MDTKEKQITTTLITGAVVLGVYSLYVYRNYVVGNTAIINDFSFWGKSFLILIPVGIVAQISVQILFAIFLKIITNEDAPSTNDERDKLIELKAIKISHWTFTLGFAIAMGSQAIGMPVWVMFVSLILAGFIASCMFGIMQLYYYRKGC